MVTFVLNFALITVVSDIQPTQQPPILAESFAKQSKLLDARVRNGMVNSSAISLWAELTHHALAAGRLMNLREFTDFLIQNSSGLSRRDISNLRGLYRDVQRIPEAYHDTLDTFQSQKNAIFPLKYEYILQQERKEAERKIIEAQAKADANQILNASLTDKILRDKGIEATLQLGNSTNAKVIVVGSDGSGGLPLILGGQ